MKRIIEDLLYAPVGLVTGAREFVPELADRGRMQVANAKMMGRIAVQQGTRVMSRQVGGIRSGLHDALVDAGLAAPDGEIDDSETATGTAGRSRPRSTTEVSPEPLTPDAPDSGDLPIIDYDSLAASQVVPRLATLDADALETIRRYESAKRGRKTILGRIAQLQR